MADQASDRERQRCPWMNRHRIQCEEEQGHASLHTARADGLIYIWSAAEATAVALNLVTPADSDDDD
jgi:hypothetical protein